MIGQDQVIFGLRRVSSDDAPSSVYIGPPMGARCVVMWQRNYERNKVVAVAPRLLMYVLPQAR